MDLLSTCAKPKNNILASFFSATPFAATNSFGAVFKELTRSESLVEELFGKKINKDDLIEMIHKNSQEETDQALVFLRPRFFTGAVVVKE